MGWFTSKPKVKKTKLKNGIVTFDPFLNKISYCTQGYKFSKSKGVFSPIRCDFTAFATYNKGPDFEFWGIEVQTYRKLSARNWEKYHELLNTINIWSVMKDFIVLGDGVAIGSDTVHFDFKEKQISEYKMEVMSGGVSKFSFENFAKVSSSSSIDMKYYGLETESDFNLSDRDCKSIVGLIDAALADVDDILSFKLNG